MWRSLPAPSLAYMYGSRGKELRGLALLDIAPYRGITWHGTMERMVCFSAWKNRSRDSTKVNALRGTKVNADAWYISKRMVQR